jgi:hypothetical protein
MAPSWPIPNPDEEFVRSFGPVLERRSEGVKGWVGEHVFCSAHHALKFGPFLNRRRLGPSSAPFVPICEYRRLYTDGKAVSRFEVGFVHSGAARSLSLGDSGDILVLVQDLLSLPVRIPNSGGAEPPTVLASAGRSLAEHYLQATTELRHGEPVQLRNEWLTPGRPQLVIECDPREVTGLPPYAQEIPNEVIGNEEVLLHFIRVEIGRSRIGVWILRRWRSADWDFVRRLRIHLTRLYTEREVLKSVLRALARKEIQPPPRSEASDSLQKYLLDSMRILSGEQLYGIDRSRVFSVAHASEDLVSEGERTAVLSTLEGIRHNVLRSVTEFTRVDERATTETVHQLIVKGSVGNLNVGGRMTVERQNITRHEINIGDGNYITGNITVARSIESSFNRVADSSVDDELKARLEELVHAFADIADRLPPEVEEEAARDLDTLTKEATSDSPREEWYNLSAQGLIEAAKTVGKVATPVITAVKAILAILA